MVLFTPDFLAFALTGISTKEIEEISYEIDAYGLYYALSNGTISPDVLIEDDYNTLTFAEMQEIEGIFKSMGIVNRIDFE